MSCPCEPCTYERRTMLLGIGSLLIIIAPIFVLWVLQQ